MSKKQILLVALNAKYIHSNPAVYSLAAYANQISNNVGIAEYTINDRYEDILRGILMKRPEVIGFSVYIWNAELMKELIEDINKIAPKIRLMAGGPEAGNDPESYLRFCELVMIGEGEENFRQIALSIKDGKEIPLEKMQGIAYKNPDLRINTGDPDLFLDMDKIPFLYQDLQAFENRIIYYESSRGCPFNCSYCLSSIEKRVRYRSMDIVKSELQFFLDKKVKQVKFVDRTFNSLRKRAIEIWSYIKEHDNGVTNFHFEIGADLLEEEELQLLSDMRPGLVQLEIGIQTTNEPTLEAIHRSADNSRIFHNVKALRKAFNINLHTDLIAGLPFEGYATFKKSFNDIYPLYADQLQLGFLKVLKGTDIYAKRFDYGLIYASRQPYEVFATKWISYEEMAKLHRVCDSLELFYNSGMFRHSLRYLEDYFESPFDMFESIADYMQEEKLWGLGLSVKRKYELLEDFGLKHGAGGNWSLWICFDQMLHTHSSRRMKAKKQFSWMEGDKTYLFDYEKIHPVTGEASYSLL
ncbi:MAG: B12-binding domain-containing radical SAM protein [Lachnospiraceae bacterium]|nr:B12-binding domain-containing radical SAM protein [Lachnospiraceae bacterium]